MLSLGVVFVLLFVGFLSIAPLLLYVACVAVV